MAMRRKYLSGISQKSRYLLPLHAIRKTVSVRFILVVGRRPLKHSGIKVKMAAKSIQGEWTTKFSKIYPKHGLDTPPYEYIKQFSEKVKPEVDRKKEHKRHPTDQVLRAKPIKFIDDI